MDNQSTISDSQSAHVVSDHLPEGFTYGHEAEASGENGQGEDSLRLQGGDIHRDLFKINAKARNSVNRAATFSHSELRHVNDDNEFTASQHQVPGGFRRQFMYQQRGLSFQNLPVTRNFVEFLDLYGDFAGEDLHESEDEDASGSEDGDDQQPPSERRPLLGRRKSTRVSAKGDASTLKTFFTLLKAFIGTGIMFLPKAFNNGGMLFSSITLLIVAAASMLAFHLLLQCREKHGGGYGDLGKAIVGSKMRSLILGSITLSQLGFVCAGIVFVAENLYSFCDAVTKSSLPISIQVLIALQLVVLVPLSFVRNISKLGPAALLADVFIFIGLGYIYYYDFAAIATRGLHPTVQLFNPESFTLTIGSAIFTFEGIGLILPIQSSMKSPQKFEGLLAVIMTIITVIFVSVGALCYATFGSATEIEVISNFPQDDKLVNAVQFLYSMAVLVGNPVQLFPALRIIEGKLFGHLSGRKNNRTKWTKNVFRTALVGSCVGIAIAGASNLDRFVALVGSFACVPLVYIYPPFLHLKGVAQTRFAKGLDILFILIGLVAMVYTTAVTIANSF